MGPSMRCGLRASASISSTDGYFRSVVIRSVVIVSSSQPGHRQTRRCGGDGDQQGADRIGHPGPIAAALNQSDRSTLAVLTVV